MDLTQLQRFHIYMGLLVGLCLGPAAFKLQGRLRAPPSELGQVELAAWQVFVARSLEYGFLIPCIPNFDCSQWLSLLFRSLEWSSHRHEPITVNLSDL